MPVKGEELLTQLGYTHHNLPLEEALTPMVKGKALDKPKTLFKQLPEEEIEALTETMARRIAQAQG